MTRGHRTEPLTPVELLDGLWVKRDDEFCIFGVHLAKARQALAILDAWPKLRAGNGIVGYGGRRSNTAAAMAAAGRLEGVPVRFHTAAGDETPELRAARGLGAELIYHRPGYPSVLKSRAEEDSRRRSWPCGLQHEAAIESVAFQMQNVTVRRVVTAVGSGVTLAGIVRGILRYRQVGRVLGVQVGALLDRNRMDLLAPGWEDVVDLACCKLPYHKEYHVTLGGIRLDPIYEAKLVPFCTKDDILWNSGARTQPCTSSPRRT